jgi:hypothetical protein
MTFTEKYGNVELRSLNWKQPFASLMLHGKIETRIWDTKYRGWVLICASKAPYNNFQILGISGNKQFGRIEETFNSVGPLAQAIAIGRLVDSRMMVKADEDRCFVEYQDPWQHTSKKTGKKTWKRLWCHVYEDVQPIDPISWVGSQGWSTMSDYVKENIIIL